MAERIPRNTAKLRALSKKADALEGEGMDGLIRAHAAFIGKGERRVREVVSDTDKMTEALKEKASRLAAPGGAPAARAKVDQTIAQLQEIQGAHITAATGRIKKSAQDTAVETHESVLRVAEVSFGVDLDSLSPAQLKAISSQRLLGATIEEYADHLTEVQKFKLGREVQIAYALGEGFDLLSDRLQSVGDGTGHELSTLARTAIQAVSNQAAVDTYAANEDILDGITCVATLDSKTCELCGPLDGRDFYYKPRAGQDGMARAPKYPLHPNCRCFTAPIVSGMPKPAVPTWGQWIKRQPADVQNEVLGEGRASLLRSGAVAPAEFITKTGALRSVETLRRAAP